MLAGIDFCPEFFGAALGAVLTQARNNSVSKNGLEPRPVFFDVVHLPVEQSHVDPAPLLKASTRLSSIGPEPPSINTRFLQGSDHVQVVEREAPVHNHGLRESIERGDERPASTRSNQLVPGSVYAEAIEVRSAVSFGVDVQVAARLS